MITGKLSLGGRPLQLYESALFLCRSGSAANLEIALQIISNAIQPFNRVIFAFWGAEELGLLGSTYYVNSLSEEERDKIALNLNFDMIVCLQSYTIRTFRVIILPFCRYNTGLSKLCPADI